MRAFLALSGGGEEGAFGAGLLLGWAERGDRPTFSTVTGISTGALIAPFAYLGPAYDAHLLRISTKVSGDDVFTKQPILAGVKADGLVDASPLRRLIESISSASPMPREDFLAVTCGSTTELIRAEIHGCTPCRHTTRRFERSGRVRAGARWCQYCNPYSAAVGGDRLQTAVLGGH